MTPILHLILLGVKAKVVRNRVSSNGGNILGVDPPPKYKGRSWPPFPKRQEL